VDEYPKPLGGEEAKSPSGESLGRTPAKLMEQLGMQRRGYVPPGQAMDRPTSHKRGMSIWGREDAALQELAGDIKRMFHSQLKLVHHNDPAHHEQAVWLIAIYTRLKKLFKSHGIEM